MTGIATVLYQLADHVFVTDLVGRKRVLDANGKREAVDAVAEISGPALGGALVAWLTRAASRSPSTPATFVVVGAAARADRRSARRVAPRRTQSGSFVDDIRTGIRVVWSDAAIRALFLATATLSFCMSFMASLYTLLLRSPTSASRRRSSASRSAAAASARLAGAALAAPASLRWGPRRTLIGALVVGAAAQMLIPLAPAVPWIAMVLPDRHPGDRRWRADRLPRQRNDAATAPAAARGARPRRGDVAGRGRSADANRRADGRSARGDTSACGPRSGARVRRCCRRGYVLAAVRRALPGCRHAIELPTPAAFRTCPCRLARPLPATMRYVAAREPGPPDVLGDRRRTGAAAEAGEVLIEVSYAGVNRPDCAQRAGTYPPPAGRITDHRARSRRHDRRVRRRRDAHGSIGDDVCALTPGGGYAEYCTTPAAFCLPIPKGCPLLEAREPARELLHRLEQPVRPRAPRTRARRC